MGHGLRFDDRHSSTHERGFRIFLVSRNSPVCPHHGKRSILAEPPDEIGVQRFFCIDCVLHAIYDLPKEKEAKRVGKVESQASQ